MKSFEQYIKEEYDYNYMFNEMEKNIIKYSHLDELEIKFNLLKFGGEFMFYFYGNKILFRTFKAGKRFNSDKRHRLEIHFDYIIRKLGFGAENNKHQDVIEKVVEKHFHSKYSLGAFRDTGEMVKSYFGEEEYED